MGQNSRMSNEPTSSPEPAAPATVLLDSYQRPMQDLRISLLDRCNFRCPYCMPETKFHADYQFLTRDQRLSHDEIFRLAGIAVSLGVTKLRLTGGEPLLDKKAPQLVSRLSTLDGIDDLALTTNGVLLAPLAQQLSDAGLQRVTISLDSMDDAIFRDMSGNRGELSKVLDGIAAAEAAGLAPIKINVVVQKGVNDHTILDVLSHFRGSGHIVRLIEFMDVGNRNGWTMSQVVPSREVLQAIQARWPVRAVDKNYAGEVARRYKYLDGQGEIGFISSVTEPFCGSCSRARLSADGTLYTCLFATEGTDLKGPLRSGASDADLVEILRSVWSQRNDRYSELRGPESADQPLVNKVEMYRMGG
ncbi:MAG: cyclic pyranopterin phosphate synthase [Woeseiaceae bacterium]